MIRVKNSDTNRDILVMWRHKIPQQLSKDPKVPFSRIKSSKNELGSTTCFICDEYKDNIIVHADSIQSKYDQFNRKIGRKISLNRAIVEADLSKETRALIWEAYFKMQGDKW